MKKYKISMWNYVDAGVMDAERAVRDWKDAGINLPMSFEYKPGDDKSYMLRLLYLCHKEGMRVIVCDARTRFSAYEKNGETAFTAGVREAIADFGGHPATFGFHIGDEPGAKNWEAAVSAFTVVNRLAPSLTHFINLFPYWEEANFTSVLGIPDGVDPLVGYADKCIDFVRRTGAKIISLDCYGQCAYFDRDYYQDCFIKNMRLLNMVAEATGAEIFISVLCTGHWAYRVPTPDDFRWQVAVSAAHGATGIHWFFFYQKTYDFSFRLNPVDLFGDRTSTFAPLSYENRVFLKFFAPRLERLTFRKVSYYNRPYGGYPLVRYNADLAGIDTIICDTSVAVTEWVRDDGTPAYTFVNMDRENPTKLRLRFGGVLAKNNTDVWLVPGQMVLADADGLR